MRFLSIVVASLLFLINPPKCGYENSINTNTFEYMVKDSIVLIEISRIFDANALKYKVEVQYDGKVTPPETLYYSKTLKDGLYEGNLDLECIKYRKDKTYAIYSGYLYPTQ